MLTQCCELVFALFPTLLFVTAFSYCDAQLSTHIIFLILHCDWHIGVLILTGVLIPKIKWCIVKTCTCLWIVTQTQVLFSSKNIAKCISLQQVNVGWCAQSRSVNKLNLKTNCRLIQDVDVQICCCSVCLLHSLLRCSVKTFKYMASFLQPESSYHLFHTLYQRNNYKPHITLSAERADGGQHSYSCGRRLPQEILPYKQGPFIDLTTEVKSW